MYGKEILAAFAVAAKQGGAVCIRASGKENINEIKKKVDLPIIGINKVFTDYPVYITPTYDSAKEILDENIEVIALDATRRSRPNNEKLEDIVYKIRKNYPDVLIMGEISTYEEAIDVIDLNFDLLSTTLSGFTENSGKKDSVDLDLIEKLSKNLDIPIIAEGLIHTPQDARKAIEAGAYSVVVGTAITRPEIITERFVKEIVK
jgi:N-acylglucosamine-6-phosphate 2-epimerase